METCVSAGGYIMIKSMTGFGKYEFADDNKKICVEIKSVNHRYCELSIKAPKKFNSLENSIRTLIKEYVKRGKIDVFITYEEYCKPGTRINYNKDIASDYFSCLKQICEDFGLDNNNINVSLISRFPDVITVEENDSNEDELWTSLENCMRNALTSFVMSREREGENLKNDIIDKLNNMRDTITAIEEHSPSIVEEYRKKLYQKVSELLGGTKVDEAVLATEIIIYADKICVDEETVRLKSHIDTMIDCLSNIDEVGRKLDFLAQEMNREANTILSKANDLTVSNMAIELKTNIEKIREQIQNIE